jgi:phospholipase/carboxylesterase
MNRLPTLPPVSSSHSHSTAVPVTAWHGSGVFHCAAEESQHVLFAPLHYEPNYGYPLVVWLHGGGDSERQLRRIMPHVSLRNYVAAAPRGTLEVPRQSGTGSGYRWVQTPEHIAHAERRIESAIADARERYHIRPDRIFLAGYECGGTMAMRIAAEHAPQFAGVMSLCGPFPTQGAPLAKLDTVRRLPLFVAAARQGTYYPTEQVCNNLRLFHSAGISITLREYPGEDCLSQMMLADIDRWMMEQIASPAAMVNVPNRG